MASLLLVGWFLLRLRFGRWFPSRLVGVVTQGRTGPGVCGGNVLLEVLLVLRLVLFDLAASLGCIPTVKALGEGLAGRRRIAGYPPTTIAIRLLTFAIVPVKSV
jgi:hypothetical protein